MYVILLYMQCVYLHVQVMMTFETFGSYCLSEVGSNTLQEMLYFFSLLEYIYEPVIFCILCSFAVYSFIITSLL